MSASQCKHVFNPDILFFRLGFAELLNFAAHDLLQNLLLRFSYKNGVLHCLQSVGFSLYNVTLLSKFCFEVMDDFIAPNLPASERDIFTDTFLCFI